MKNRNHFSFHRNAQAQSAAVSFSADTMNAVSAVMAVILFALGILIRIMI